MRLNRRMAAALALAALTLGAAARSQESPFEQLKRYDYQDRRPVAAIKAMFQEAAGDPAKQAVAEDGLIGVLKDPAAAVPGKQEACQLLWIYGTARSVPALAAMLRDDTAADMARYALERNADPSAGKALIAAAKGASGKRLVGIVGSIGDRGDPTAVGLLKGLARSSDALVADAAVAALGKVGTPTALAVLQALPNKTLPVYQAMLRCAGRMASAKNSAPAAKVYESLALRAPFPVVQAAALQGLAAMGSPKAATIGLSDLMVPKPLVQEAAARVVGALPQTSVAQRALSLWGSLPPAARIALLAAWSDTGQRAGARVALDEANSDDPVLRATAIEAAARCGGAGAVPRLAELAASGQDRDAARQALAGMPGQEAEQAILQAVRQGKPEVRAALMGVLADRGAPGTMQALQDAAQGPEPKVAVEALRAIGRIGGPPQRAELVRVLTTTQDDQVRDAAQNAIVAITQRAGDRDQAAEPLLAAYSTAAAPAKCALLGALANLGGDQALDELTKATTSTDEDVKRAAISGLADTWADSRPLPTLLDLAKSDPDKATRVQALRGYLRLVSQDERASTSQWVARLAEAIKVAERPDEKKQALSVLRDCRIPAAMELAAQSLDDPAVFPEAADTVIYLAGPRRKGNTDQPAVTGPETAAALAKVIALTKDENQKAQAEKLKG